MTVKELIDNLLKLPQDAVVLTNHDDSCGPDYEVNGAYLREIDCLEDYDLIDEYSPDGKWKIGDSYVYLSAGS